MLLPLRGVRADDHHFQGDSYHLVYGQPRYVDAVQTVDHVYPGCDIVAFDVFAPCPPQMPGRQDLQATFWVNGTDLTDSTRKVEAGTGRELFWDHQELQNPVHEIQEAYEFKGELIPCHLVQGPGEPPPPLSEADRQMYTMPNREVNYTFDMVGPTLEDRGLVIRPDESKLHFAYRAYQYVGVQLPIYSQAPASHLFSDLLNESAGDCGAAAQLFVGLCRANGIPARTLIGRWATGSKDEGDTWAGCHCLAQVWVDGIGWIPVNPSTSAGSSGRDPSGFGNFDADFIACHTDIDLVFDKNRDPLGILQCDCISLHWTADRTPGHDTTTGLWQVNLSR